MKKKIKVLQFICPTGFYGAERWILALTNNSEPGRVTHQLAVTDELDEQDLEIINQFPEDSKSHKITMNGRFDLSAITKLSAIIKQQQIDIIHTHGYKSDIIGLLAAKKTGIKCVSTPHGFGTSKELKIKLFIWLGNFSLRFFDAIVPLSKQLLNEVISFGIPERKCIYIRNGVDLTEIDPFLKHKTAIPEAAGKKKQIGFIGQMIPRKNIKDAIDIFNQLWLDDDQMEFHLLGDGESRKELEAHAASLPSAADINFLGFRNDRLERLKDLDLFVMTSEDEGIPRCLMEACAMETPVAAYDIPGIDQLITHEKTGLLAPFGDKETLAKYWDILLNDKEYSQQLSKASREFVLEKFSGQRMAQEYTDLFSDLLCVE